MTGLLDRLQAAVGDRYRVEEEIGRGGMALVFRAVDTKHGRTVAIKVLRPELAAAVGAERFLREIEIAAKLQHPHVLPVYDSGEAGGILYYVMPFVPGESLRERLLREHPLPPEEAIRIAREVGHALDYAHRQGIVHRDIKPANILLSDGHAVVADFGIARALTASAQVGLTQAGMAVGTPSYMSPEQALGEQNLDGRTDVYALGCVLYEMLVGSPPYDGPTPQSVVAKALAGERPRLQRDTLGVQPILERALAREPVDRFPTASEFTAALDAVSSGVGYRFRLQRRQRVGIVAVTATVAVALAAFAFWPRGFRVEGDPRLSLIIFPFENQTGDPALGYLEKGAMNLLGLAAAQWRDLRVFDDERTASLLRRNDVEAGADLDFDKAQALARQAKVGTLVLGDLRREGDSLTVEAKIHDVRSGERVATEIVRAGWGADPRPLFDQLAARILRITGAPPGERPDLATQTTKSLEAYQAYIRGVGHLQHFLLDSARAELERAIALDSTFALAYVRLRDAVGWETRGAGGVGNPNRRRELIAKAQQYSASLPPRLRSLILYYAAYEAGDFGRAREIATDMIRRDSTDVEAWYQLGEAHFHDPGTGFPPKGGGNPGKALRTFQRALQLDSTYVLAYQHILDGLSACGAPNNGLLCLADSSVVALPQDLDRRYGADEVKRNKAEARAEQAATARAWVNVEPTLPRARQQLVQALMAAGKLDDAGRETEELRKLGALGTAAGLDAAVAYERGQYGEASWWLSRGLAAGDTLTVIQIPLIGQQGTNIFAGGGRRAEAQRFVGALWDIIPRDSLPGPGAVFYPKADLLRYVQAVTSAQVGYPADSATAAMHGWLDAVDRRTGTDSVARRAAMAGSAPAVLMTYMLERDSTLLRRALPFVSDSSILRAEMAFERGDTAEARRRAVAATRGGQAAGTIDPRLVPADASRLWWALGWGDVLARVGLLEEAARVYAYADSVPPPVSAPGALVRSWAERAALMQQLGRTGEAITLYRRFIDAWERADPALQPMVERARRAVDALGGRIEEPRR